MKERQEQDGFNEQERRRTNRNAIVSVALAAVIIFTFFLGYFVRGASEPAMAQKLNEIMRLFEDASVLTGDKTADDYAKSFVELIKPYDPYAAYYTPQEYKQVLAEDAGRYSGVGIGFGKGAGGTYDGTIAKVYLNSSAYKAGVKKGDVLVAGLFKEQEDYTYFADCISEDKTLLQVISEFFSQFDNGEEINLKFYRGEEYEVSVEKNEYIVSYVEYKDDEKTYYFSTEEDGFSGREKDGGIDGLSDDTAYIKLYEFEGGAASQFAEAMAYMKERGKSKLILDLRDNGGGLITVLLEIVAYLINDYDSINDEYRDVIKVMWVQEKFALKSYSTSSNRFDSSLTDISVIANCGTASASEALIGALNDYGEREIHKGAKFNLGRLVLTEKHETRDVYCTFGKGIMQTTYGLKSGGALVLTTAHIYWPEETSEPICVQDKGIMTTDDANCVADAYAIERANDILHIEE